MSTTYCQILDLKTNFIPEANTINPDQTAPKSDCLHDKSHQSTQCRREREQMTIVVNNRNRVNMVVLYVANLQDAKEKTFIWKCPYIILGPWHNFSHMEPQLRVKGRITSSHQLLASLIYWLGIFGINTEYMEAKLPRYTRLQHPSSQ